MNCLYVTSKCENNNENEFQHSWKQNNNILTQHLLGPYCSLSWAVVINTQCSPASVVGLNKIEITTCSKLAICRQQEISDRVISWMFKISILSQNFAKMCSFQHRFLVLKKNFGQNKEFSDRQLFSPCLQLQTTY